MSKITCAESYDYPDGGERNETVATLAGGRQAWINTQYASVTVRHTKDCAVSKQTACYPQAQCDCGAIDDIDVAALVADARVNGKFGRRPESKRIDERQSVLTPAEGLCPKCGTYCYGDCAAM